MEAGYIDLGRQQISEGKRLGGSSRFLLGMIGHLILYRMVFPLADHIFVQSDEMKRSLVRKGVSADKMSPVPMGINTELYNPDALAIADDEFYNGKRALLYVGGLDAIRDMTVPVAGVATVMTDLPDIVLVFIGRSTAQEREIILDICIKAGVSERVIFLGQLPLSLALSHVLRADVCLAPCPTTPVLAVATPTKLVEYLYMGSRVVANEHPDQSRVIQGARAGELCDFTAESFAAAIKRALGRGRLSIVEKSLCQQWVKTNRDYGRLSDIVLKQYAKL